MSYKDQYKLNKLKFLSYFHELSDILCFLLGHMQYLHSHLYLFLLPTVLSFLNTTFLLQYQLLSYNNFYKDSFHLNIVNIDLLNI